MNRLEEQLIAHYFGESADPEAFERRLATDQEVRRLYNELSAALEAARGSEPPEPPSDYASRVWQRIQPRIEPQPRSRGWEFLTMKQVVPAAVLAGLILGAFLLGRYVDRPAESQATEISERARERVMLVAVGDHLDRAQVVLVELLNADGVVDVREEQEVVADLLTDNRLYQTAAEQSGNPLLAEVLADLEPIWIELRHAPNSLSPDDRALLRTLLEEKGTLFKIRVLGARIDQEEQQGLPLETETF